MKSSTISNQLNKHQDLFSGKAEVRVLAAAIEDQNLDAVNAIYPGLPTRAKQIIDIMIAKSWNVSVSSLSAID